MVVLILVYKYAIKQRHRNGNATGYYYLHGPGFADTLTVQFCGFTTFSGSLGIISILFENFLGDLFYLLFVPFPFPIPRLLLYLLALSFHLIFFIFQFRHAWKLCYCFIGLVVFLSCIWSRSTVDCYVDL